MFFQIFTFFSLLVCTETSHENVMLEAGTYIWGTLFYY